MKTIDPAAVLNTIALRLQDYASAYVTRMERIDLLSDLESDKPVESDSLARTREDFVCLQKHIAGYCEGVDDMLGRYHGCTSKLWHIEVVENFRQWEKDTLYDSNEAALRAKIAEALFSYDDE